MIARSTREAIDQIIGVIAKSETGVRFCDLERALPQIDNKRMHRLLERLARDPRVERRRVYKAGPGGIYKFTLKPEVQGIEIPVSLTPMFSTRRFVQDMRADEVDADRDQREAQRQNLASLEYLRGLQIDGNTDPELQDIINFYRRIVGLLDH